MGVTLMYGLKVQDYVNDQLIFANGTPVFAKTVIWAAGVTCLPIKGIPKESVGRGGRLLVDEYNTVNGFDTIFAVGDIAFQTADKNFPNGHPQMVQVAMQQGGRLAKNLIATSHNKPRKSFSYFDKGSMAIFGKNKAVADLQIPVKLFLGGFSACVIWLFIHLTYLVNPRSRAKTFYNWMVAYLTNDQVLRMIIRPFKEKQAG